MTSSREKIIEVLAELVVQIDEDCPEEFRSKHLIQAIRDAEDIICEEDV